MIKNFLFITFFLFYSFSAQTAENGFSKQFFSEPSPTENELTTSESSGSIISNNKHPLLRYDLNKYFIIGTFIELNNDKRSLAIVRSPDGTDHIIFEEDILSNNEPPWIIKKIQVRGITIIKENTENLDEDGNITYLEKNIDVSNSSINLTKMKSN